MKNVLAVDIGGTHFRTGLFDEQGRRLLVLEGDAAGLAAKVSELSAARLEYQPNGAARKADRRDGPRAAPAPLIHSRGS